jgi:hypothetical protein
MPPGSQISSVELRPTTAEALESAVLAVLWAESAAL